MTNSEATGMSPCRFGCRLVDHHRPAPAGGGGDEARLSVEASVSHAFSRSGDAAPWLLLLSREYLEASGFVRDDAFGVECTITVLTRRRERWAPRALGALGV
ncbi:hypothetical protein ACP70R_043508 [Stipagrostis hirtigluma subsp. patula]